MDHHIPIPSRRGRVCRRCRCLRFLPTHMLESLTVSSVKLRPEESCQVDQSCLGVSAIVVAAVVMSCILVTLGPRECSHAVSRGCQLNGISCESSWVVMWRSKADITTQLSVAHKSLLFSTPLTSHLFAAVLPII